ncbi:MAG: metal ABC transporter solute-binding protein, Zn/Mn family, partial [Porticoccaceae bacterium]
TTPHHSDAHRDHSDHNMARDPHIWLNPQNGNHIAFEIQRRLDLPIRQIITQHQIDKLRGEIASARSSSYISHHDAYDHFVEAFALRAGLSIRDARGGPQGLKTQYQLRKTITEAKVKCILVEPHYGTKDVELIAEEFNLPVIDFDTQGLSQSISDTAYFEFISSLVTQFKICAQ